MEEVISTLEREFKRVYLDIEYVSHRLEIDTSRTRNDNIPDVGIFMKRLNELENKLMTINDRTEKITSKREELLNQVVDILNDNYKTLSNVNNSMSGFKTDADSFTEAKRELSDSLSNSHILFDSAIENKTENNDENNDENNLPNNINITNNKTSTTKKLSTTTKNDNKASKSTKLANGDKTIKKTIEITKEKFDGVPLSIRGRCKFEDVVNLLSTLKSHHKLNKSILTLAELDSCGFKVGKTGDSVISTLKSLGLISKTKEGVVLIAN